MSEEFEKTAQETIVAYKAKCAEGGKAAASVIAPLISRAAASNADPRQAVASVCRGAMKGILLNGQSVPDAAIKLIEALPDMTLTTRNGPEAVMSWVMEGIAGAMPIAGAETREAIAAQIEERFMGASQIFQGFCEEAAAKG
jgi:hypothetical protein